MKIRQTGDNWFIKNFITGEVTTQTRKANDNIFPDTEKVQEYIHLTKGPDKPKFSKGVAKKIGRLFQGIRDTEGTDT